MIDSLGPTKTDGIFRTQSKTMKKHSNLTPATHVPGEHLLYHRAEHCLSALVHRSIRRQLSTRKSMIHASYRLDSHRNAFESMTTPSPHVALVLHSILHNHFKRHRTTALNHVSQAISGRFPSISRLFVFHILPHQGVQYLTNTSRAVGLTLV